MEITSAIQQDFLELDSEMTVSQMAGKLKQYEKRLGLVFRNNKYLGLVEKKKLLRTNVSAEAKISNFVQKTTLLGENADIVETAYLMFQSNVDFLPVERDREIVGVIRGMDIADLALAIPEVANLKVGDLRFEKTARVNKYDPVSTAINLMYEQHVDHVPVFESGKLYGILSYKDLLRKYLNWSPKRNVSTKFNTMLSSRSAQVDTTTFGSIPTENFSSNDNLISVHSTDSLKSAITLMTENKVHDLLVMEGEKFEGLLTVKNILRAIGSLKIPQNFNVTFVGLSKLDWHPYEQEALKKITSNEAFKLQRRIHSVFSLNIHIKEYEKEGKQKKFSVHLRIQMPGQITTASQEDWDWRTAVRKTFTNANNAVKKKLKEN